MKKVVLIRHAESDLPAPHEKDIDRSLTSKGKEDADKMATEVFNRGFQPDKIISSPALRARQTANIFAAKSAGKINSLHLEEKLYEPFVKSFYQVIESLSDDLHTVFIFSHNPGITLFIYELDIHTIPGMPPCGVFAFELHADKWHDLRVNEKSFLFYSYPGLL